LGKWAAELSHHFNKFEKRTSIKPQVLADWTPSQNPIEEKKQPD
jgi:hypothetical protein